MSIKFKDDKRSYIEDDIKKIQTKPGMYISYLGERGALHLAKEVIQNAIDECMNDESPADTIKVELDITTGILSVEDNGRGIPENDLPMDILCTKIQSGSKFTRSNNVNTAGENGCGNTAVNALSDMFVWESYRNHKVHIITFKEGTKVDDTHGTNMNKDYGCIVKFRPSVKYLGRGAVINKDQLLEWISKTSYFLPDKTTMKFKIVENGKKIFSEKYKKQPISSMLTGYVTGNVVTLSSQWKKTENVMNLDKGYPEDVERDLHLDVAFGLTSDEQPYIDSYCNSILTPDGGVHLESSMESIWRYFVRESNNSLTEREKAKFTVTKNDVLNSLSIVVSLNTAYQVMFVGQTKNAISNDLLIGDIKYQVMSALQKYFGEKSKDELMRFIKTFKLSAKARVEANKVRNTIIEKVDNFDKHNMTKYTPANNTGKAYKELFLCEGKSALGTLSDGRDADTQAFIAFRGVTANGFKRDLEGILKNAEYKDLTKILKCGIGKSCDVNKLYFNKIIIATDADIDGRNIASGICTFFALYMPQIIEAGRLYRVLPPLYHIDNKTHPYVIDKREYVDTYIDEVLSAYKIKFDEFGKACSEDDFRFFLYDTVQYVETLERIAKHFGVNMGLIEIVSAVISSYITEGHAKNAKDIFKQNKFFVTLLSEVQNKYPEISLSNNNYALRGVIDGSYQSLDLSPRFINKVEELFDIYQKYGYMMYIKDKSTKEFRKMTLLDFLNLTEKFKPSIITRYKGLGEMNSDQMWETTLNPNNRRLIQLTFGDIERDLKVLKKLHGDGKKDNLDRKLMMAEYHIKREDLDN